MPIYDVATAYLVYGRDFLTGQPKQGTDEDETFVGTDSGAALVGGGGNDRLIVGASGSASGGRGDDIIELQTDGSRYVGPRLDGGTGYDVLKLGEGASLFLGPRVGLTAEPTNIEEIDMRGNGPGVLALQKLAVQRLSPDTNTLRIRRDAEDRVDVTDFVWWLDEAASTDEVIVVQTAGFAVITEHEIRLGVGGGDSFSNVDLIEVFGSPNTDNINGSSSPVPLRMFGNGGNDTLFGSDYADTLDGGRGDDFVFGGNGDDIVSSGYYGRDTLGGGSGNDIFRNGSVPAAIYELVTENVTLQTLPSGRTKLTGVGDDRLNGSFDAAFLIGIGSRHTMDAREFAGSVTLLGGSGDDYLLGSRQADFIAGGSGNDTLVAQDGRDTLFGEDGDDRLVGGPTGVVLQELAQGEPLTLWSSNGRTRLTGRGNDRLVGTFVGAFLIGGDNVDDVLDASGFDGSVTLLGEGGNDLLIGSARSDVFFGGNGNDTLIGLAGNDLLRGESGNDVLLGRSGDDSIFGGNGDDLMSGGGGLDILKGGPGSDRLLLSTDPQFALLNPAISAALFAAEPHLLSPI